MISKACIELAGRVIFAKGIWARIQKTIMEPNKIWMVDEKRIDEAMDAATKDWPCVAML